MTAIQLGVQYAVPAVFDGAVGSGQREYISASRNHGAGAGLHSRGADLGDAQIAEQFAEAGNILVLDRIQRFRCNVAPGQAGPAGGDDDIDLLVVNPLVELSDENRFVVSQQVAVN